MDFWMKVIGNMIIFTMLAMLIVLGLILCEFIPEPYRVIVINVVAVFPAVITGISILWWNFAYRENTELWHIPMAQLIVTVVALLVAVIELSIGLGGIKQMVEDVNAKQVFNAIVVVGSFFIVPSTIIAMMYNLVLRVSMRGRLQDYAEDYEYDEGNEDIEGGCNENYEAIEEYDDTRIMPDNWREDKSWMQAKNTVV